MRFQAVLRIPFTHVIRKRVPSFPFNKHGPAANDWRNALKGNDRIGLMKLFHAFLTKALPTNGGTDGGTDGGMDGGADGGTDGGTDGRTDGRTDGWTDGWTDGRKGRTD